MLFSVDCWQLWGILLLFCIGLLLTVKGGDLFVDAAVIMAEASGIPHFVIGATVVSFATATPELLVSLMGSLRGNSELAIGNAVGSVTANTGMILALSCICLPSAVSRRQYGFKAGLLILATAVLYTASLGKQFSILGGAVLIAIYAISVYDSMRCFKNNSSAAKETGKSGRGMWLGAFGKFIAGAAGLVFGADFLVTSATETAIRIGVSQAVISATIVAVGTSLPELVTTITAVIKRQTSLGCGNIIGANLIDIAVILPICAIASPQGLTVCRQNIFIDFPVCLITLIAAFVPMLRRGKFSRTQGLCLLAIYIAYTVFIAFFNPF